MVATSAHTCTHPCTHQSTCSWMLDTAWSALGDQVMQYLFIVGVQRRCAWWQRALENDRAAAPQAQADYSHKLLRHRHQRPDCTAVLRPRLHSESTTCVSCLHRLARYLVRAPTHLCRAASLSVAQLQCMTLCEQRADSPLSGRQVSWLAAGLLFSGKTSCAIKEEDDASEPKMTLSPVSWSSPTNDRLASCQQSKSYQWSDH